MKVEIAKNSGNSEIDEASNCTSNDSILFFIYLEWLFCFRSAAFSTTCVPTWISSGRTCWSTTTSSTPATCPESRRWCRVCRPAFSRIKQPTLSTRPWCTTVPRTTPTLGTATQSGWLTSWIVVTLSRSANRPFKNWIQTRRFEK